jgi:hypothetical protein
VVTITVAPPMNEDEFQRVVEECRSQRGALMVLRLAAGLLSRPPRMVAVLEKSVQEWSRPAAIGRAARAVIEEIGEEAGEVPAEAVDLLRAVLVVTDERVAEQETQTG